jgi:hypothetical protein
VSGEKLYCDSKITNCTILTSLRCQLSADFSLLDKPVICTPVATTQTATQFVLDVDCNGVAVRIMYDTGASISFSRPGLVIGSIEELDKSKAIKVTLGDASVTQTAGSRGHVFDVYGKAHDWIFQEMQLPKGIDLIIGMDFMTHHDVLLLPRRKQVLFGADLAFAAGTSMKCAGTELNSAETIVGRACHLSCDSSDATVSDSFVALESTQILGEVDAVSGPTLEMRSENPDEDVSSSSASSGNIDDTTIFDMDNGDSVEYVDSETFAELAALHLECSKHPEGKTLWSRYASVRSSSASTASDAVRARMCKESAWKSKTKTQEDSLSFLCTVNSTEVHENSEPGSLAYVTADLSAHSVKADSSAGKTVNSTEAGGVQPIPSKSTVQRQARYEEFSRAISTADNPVDPTPENLEAWLEAAYPKDVNGVSIRHQIDMTMPEHREWVEKLMKGEVCELAYSAFNMAPKFEPPPWAEKMKLKVNEKAGIPKAGARIRCPVHMREHLLEFHTKLYERMFIQPATDCESYAPVLIIRKPDTAEGKPRGFRFVVDLRNRNETIHGMANYLPEACVMFEYLRGAKVISVFDVKDGYWACPLDESSIPLTAFQSECGAWVWKCLPQGLSCSGPYFHSWLTRVYRKYNIVIDQTRYMPVEQESAAISALSELEVFNDKLLSMKAKAVDGVHNVACGISNVQPDPASQEQTVADLRQRFAKVKRKFDRVELDIETHGADLGAIKTDIVNFAAQSEIYEGKLSTAMLNSDSMDIDTPSTECEQLPSCVRATILMSGGDLAILDGDRTDLPCTMSKDHSYVAMRNDHNDVVYASRAAHARMLEASPDTVNVDVWSTAVTGMTLDGYCAACTAANVDSHGDKMPVDLMVGGIPMLTLTAKSRDDRKPSDLGIWNGQPFCSLYLDDAICASMQGGTQGRSQALTFLRISAIERIPLNEKAHLMCAYVRFLGMINGNGLVIPCPEKVKCIVALTRPADIKGLQSFLGSVNWFRKWIISMAQLQAPLNVLLTAESSWDWTDECEQAWLNLKRALMKFPVLRTFDPKLETLMYTDSSKVHIGGVLCQRLTDGSLVVCAYYSRSLRGPELKYPIQQQEMLAIVACCGAFEHFLLASHVTVRTCSDHRSLAQSFVGLSKAACDRITRWVQKVCVYNMTLEYIPGAQLEFADMLSRMMKAPEDAWESMDVIDARDFELHPLAAMCPSYMQYCFLHAEARREPGDTGPALAGLAVDDETLSDVANEIDKFNDTWAPHEIALLLPCPRSDTLIKQSDMLCCHDFRQIYSALMVHPPSSTRSKRQRAGVSKYAQRREETISEAQSIIDSRYEKLELKKRNWDDVKIPASRMANAVQRYSLVDGLLYYNSPDAGPLLCIPDIYDSDGVNHRARMFEEMHATAYRGHRSTRSTQLAMTKRVYWPNMNKDICEMVKSCSCQADKIRRQPQQGKLTNVQTPLSIFESYNADFMGPFPKSKNGNDSILLFVDRFSRRLFLYAVSKHMTSEECADMFVENICYREGRGLPLSIVSDNDKLFTANYWRTVFKRFGTTLHMATARTQSSNGLAERYVAVVEEILRTRVNYLQNDWEELLAVIMFVCNNQDKVALLGRTPIEIETGATPIVPIDLVSKLTLAKAVQKNRQGSAQPKAAAIARLERLELTRIMVVRQLEEVKLDQKHYADRRRRDIVGLVVGGKAYVNMPAEQLAQHGLRPSAKLQHRMFGPFKILKRVSANSFELELPTSAVNSRTISVFHVKHLQSCPAPHKYASPSSLEVIPVSGEGERAEWEICEILDRRTRRAGKLEYLCRYKGYPLLDDCQWRSEAELEELARNMLTEFQDVYANRAGPGAA